MNFHNHEPLFARLSLVTPQCSFDLDEGIHLDMEINPGGVHSSWTVFEKDLAAGAQIFIATEEEVAACRGFSCGSPYRDAALAARVREREERKAERRRKLEAAERAGGNKETGWTEAGDGVGPQEGTKQIDEPDT